MRVRDLLKITLMVGVFAVGSYMMAEVPEKWTFNPGSSLVGGAQDQRPMTAQSSRRYLTTRIGE